MPWKFDKVWSIIPKVTGQFRLTRKVTRSKIVILKTTATLAQYIFFFYKIWYLAENERENIAFLKIPVIKGVYKPLFFTEYLVIMLFLSTGIFSKRQNMLYMVWRYTTEKLTIINAGLFRAHHLNYGSNIELKSGISQSILKPFLHVILQTLFAGTTAPVLKVW